jgi:hypothetical protein
MTGTRFTFLLIAEDGTSHEHRTRLRTGEVDGLLRRAVGGWLELVTVPDPRLYVWCDEDDGLIGRHPNPVGSLLVARLGGRPLTRVGPIAVTGRRGNTTASLTDMQVDALVATLADRR